MWTDPGTARLLIVCVTIVTLVTIAGLVWLASRGSSIEALGALILGLVGLVIREVLSLKRTVKDVAAKSDQGASGGPL